MATTQDAILSLCRDNGFRTRGCWGMRTDVALLGYPDKRPKAACVVLDLQRSLPHPTVSGVRIPVVLAHGDTWTEVLTQLRTAGELPEV